MNPSAARTLLLPLLLVTSVASSHDSRPRLPRTRRDESPVRLLEAGVVKLRGGEQQLQPHVLEAHATGRHADKPSAATRSAVLLTQGVPVPSTLAAVAETGDTSASLAAVSPGDVFAARTQSPETTDEAKAYSGAITATIWSFVLTAAFGLGVVLPMKGAGGCVDFFTAFLVEKSLSVDNLFVFLMIFEYFKVPEPYTARVLKWGILSALVLRGVMIAAGVMVINRFRPVLLFFSLVLVISAAKMLGPEEESVDLAHNPLVRLTRSIFDATDTYDGDNFLTVVDGVRKATPLLIVLLVVELSDVMFAIDSIPAVVGVTQDPLIVYSSNIFALLALRSLYTLLAKSVDTLCYLKPAVAMILLFIGAKMSLEYFHVHLPKWLSPTVICVLLTGGTIASLYKNHLIELVEATKRKKAGQQPEEEESSFAATAATAAGLVGNALV